MLLDVSVSDVEAELKLLRWALGEGQGLAMGWVGDWGLTEFDEGGF